jgi:REP element-mobilizing transposase RayT
VFQYPAEIFGSKRCGFYQREEFHLDSQELQRENFWARRYFVSTVRLDEDMVRNYIREQEADDERYE